MVQENVIARQLMFYFAVFTTKRSTASCGHAFFDQITLHFPQPKRRKQEPVDFFRFDRFISIHHLRPPCFRGFARVLSSASEFRRSPPSAASSCCFHQYSPLVNPFLSGSSQQSLGAVVPNRSATRARIIMRIKLPNGSSDSNNRYAGQARPERSA